MSQHDYDLANASGASFRSDLNNALAAIVSQNSGASAPSTTFAYQLWADTTNGLLKQRDSANSSWLTLGKLGVAYGMAAEAGTKSMFQQTAAPTGWTKDTTHNDKSLRVVSGTASSGGATAFTSVFGSGKSTSAFTLTTGEIPSHTHSVTPSTSSTGQATNTITAAGNPGTVIGNAAYTANATGSGGSHAHTLSLDLQYVDVIVCTKS